MEPPRLAAGANRCPSDWGQSAHPRQGAGGVFWRAFVVAVVAARRCAMRGCMQHPAAPLAAPLSVFSPLA